MDNLIVIEPEDCDSYQLPEGVLMVGRSDQFLSIGFMEVEPGRSLGKQVSPVPGIFSQVEGKPVFRIEGRGEPTEVALSKGETVKVPSGIPYTVTNPSTGKCLVSWRFEGDVSGMFEKLKEQFPLIPPEPSKKTRKKR